ncbi:hypothetical protein AB0I95_14985 [Micromonospora sp. NPDC049751]|uniref:hypothetical protein n=1 Tax=Micromonospora sp. NPDC049751 TaxID=3154837 RepID=UPI0034038476
MARRSRRCRRKGCRLTNEEHELVAWVERLKLTTPSPDLLPPRTGGTPEGR